MLHCSMAGLGNPEAAAREAGNYGLPARNGVFGYGLPQR